MPSSSPSLSSDMPSSCQVCRPARVHFHAFQLTQPEQCHAFRYSKLAAIECSISTAYRFSLVGSVLFAFSSALVGSLNGSERRSELCAYTNCVESRGSADVIGYCSVGRCSYLCALGGYIGCCGLKCLGRGVSVSGSTRGGFFLST
jgi:hypothetical protein